MRHSMTRAADLPTENEVSEFYDRLDDVYGHQAALHVHHGLWLRGDETRGEAKRALVTWVGEQIPLNPGDRCIDIGSGYGETARQLAKTKNIVVTAVTNSAAQQARALRENAGETVEYRAGDWCSNDLPSGEYDAAWAIESLEHMRDLDHALQQCKRVLKRGARLLVLSWVAGERTGGWREALLVQPLMRDNRLAALRTEHEIVSSFCRTGFGQVRVRDLTPKVRRTWRPTVKGVLKQLGLASADSLEPGLAWPTVRIALAYEVGAMRFVAVSAVSET